MRFFSFLITLLLLSFPAQAKQQLDMSAFKRIPVLHEGRIKPIDSYARAKMKEFIGSTSNADEWLAEIIFNPADAAETSAFLVASPDAKSALKLEENKKHFTLQEIQAALQKSQKHITSLYERPAENLTPAQNEILHLQDKVISYNRLLRSFSMILPLNLGKDYLALYQDRKHLASMVKNIIAKKGTNPDNYTDEEKRMATLAFSLQQIGAAGQGNDEFKIIPLNGTFIAPWQIMPDEKESLNNWRIMAEAWREQNPEKWQKYTHLAA